MKSLCVVASLIAALIAPQALAQLGPAGVPGAPGLAETDPSVKAARPAPTARPAADEASGTQKSAAKTARAKAGKACRAGTAKGAGQCKPRSSAKSECSQSTDPARCELNKKAYETCRNKLGAEHRQCLRDVLVPKK